MSKHRAGEVEELTNQLQAQGPDEYPTGYYRHLAEQQLAEAQPLPEDGDPVEVINATAMMQPKSFYLHLDIDSVHISLAVPHEKLESLDVIVGTLPSLINNALLTLRKPDEEIDDSADA